MIRRVLLRAGIEDAATGVVVLVTMIAGAAPFVLWLGGVR